VSVPTQNELRALGLDDASLDAAWRKVMVQLRAEGRDPDAVVECAGANLTAWRERSAMIGGGATLYVYDSAPVAPHLYEPTTNTRCARCNRPREEH